MHSRTYFSLKNVKHHHFSSFNCQSARPDDFCSREEIQKSLFLSEMRAVRYYSILFFSCMLYFASVLWPIKFIIGKHYCESVARILLTCMVMLCTRTVIMADIFCPYFGDYFCCFCFGNGTFYFSFRKESIKWLILDKTRTGKRHDSLFLVFFFSGFNWKHIGSYIEADEGFRVISAHDHFGL